MLKYLTLAALVLACSFLTQGCTGLERASSGVATVNGTHLAWDRAGQGPDLVLIQGAQLGRGMWDPQFESLAEQYRVLRYDVRGFGQSGATGTPYGHHEDLTALLDHLGIS